jgi:hypothetical protein
MVMAEVAQKAKISVFSLFLFRHLGKTLFEQKETKRTKNEERERRKRKTGRLRGEVLSFQFRAQGFFEN